MWRRRFYNAVAMFPQRYVVGIVSFFCLACLYNARNISHIALREMLADYPPTYKPANGTVCSTDELGSEATHRSLENKKLQTDKFHWDVKVMEHRATAYAIGYISTHLPGGIVADRIGGKFPVILGVLFSAACNFITPLVVKFGSVAFLVIQFLSGFFTGPVIPSVMSILARWVPPGERGRFGGMVLAGIIFADAVNTSLGHYITVTYGWNSVFVCYGVFGTLAALSFHIWGYSDPDAHFFLTEKERSLLRRKIDGITPRQDLAPIPWCKILTSLPVWALIAGQWGHKWSDYMLDEGLDSYSTTLLRKNPPPHVGFVGTMPFIAKWITAILGGIIGDLLVQRGLITLKVNRRTLTAFASCGPAASILLAAYQGCNSGRLYACYFFGLMTSGFFYPGLKTSVIDLSPNYAGTLMALVNGFSQSVRILAPWFQDTMTVQNTLYEWRKMFWITYTIVTYSGMFFINFSEHEIASWNQTRRSKRRR